MKDDKVIQLVARCEAILSEVEAHASAIKTMHEHMVHMVEHNKKLQAELKLIEREEMQKQLLNMASKAAKKAVKKSIARSKALDQLNDEFDG